jgi:hypothetical protein
MQNKSNKAEKVNSIKAGYMVVKRWFIVSAAILVTSTTLSAQTTEKRFVDRLMLDIGGQVLVPSAQPAGLGGGLGVGYQFRDFSLFLRGAGMIAEPGVSQRMIMNPTLRTEGHFVLLRSFITLLPFVDVGSISVRLRVPVVQTDPFPPFNQTVTTGETSSVTSLYAALGIGAEILLSHELSLIPRIGVAHALLYSGNDSNNFSGPTVELAMRYTFGRSRGLDY